MLTETSLDSITIAVKDEALRLFGDKLIRVVLYGSYARGDYEATSDIAGCSSSSSRSSSSAESDCSQRPPSRTS